MLLPGDGEAQKQISARIKRILAEIRLILAEILFRCDTLAGARCRHDYCFRLSGTTGMAPFCVQT